MFVNTKYTIAGQASRPRKDYDFFILSFPAIMNIESHKER